MYEGFLPLRMNGTCYVHYAHSNKWTQLPFHEYGLGDSFLETSHVFFKANKRRIYALLRQIQCATSLAWVRKSRMPLHVSRVKKIVRLENGWLQQRVVSPSREPCRYHPRNVLQEVGCIWQTLLLSSV